jgi:hypothetical protein
VNRRDTAGLTASVLHANPQWPAMSLPALDKGFMKLILISMTFLKMTFLFFWALREPPYFYYYFSHIKKV